MGKFNDWVFKLKTRVPEFARQIAPFYEALGWKWGPIDRVPSKLDIEDELYKLIDKLREDEPGSISTGGLSVYYEKEDEFVGMSFTHDVECGTADGYWGDN